MLDHITAEDNVPKLAKYQSSKNYSVSTNVKIFPSRLSTFIPISLQQRTSIITTEKRKTRDNFLIT